MGWLDRYCSSADRFFRAFGQIKGQNDLFVSNHQYLRSCCAYSVLSFLLSLSPETSIRTCPVGIVGSEVGSAEGDVSGVSERASLRGGPRSLSFCMDAVTRILSTSGTNSQELIVPSSHLTFVSSRWLHLI